MSDADHPDIEALVDEVESLREENQRLRSLLGLDQPTRQNAADPWEPSLYPTRKCRTFGPAGPEGRVQRWRCPEPPRGPSGVEVAAMRTPEVMVDMPTHGVAGANG